MFQLATAGDFDLLAVDMVSDGGSGPARFSTFRDGVFLTSVDLSGGAGSVLFNNPQFLNIDEFRVTLTESHFTFDNISFVNSVPVPGPIVGAGLPGLILASGGLLWLVATASEDRLSTTRLYTGPRQRGG